MELEKDPKSLSPPIMDMREPGLLVSLTHSPQVQARSLLWRWMPRVADAFYR